MEFVVEMLLEFLGDFLLEVLLQAIVEIGFRALVGLFTGGTFRAPRAPLLAVAGAALGGASLLVAPRAFFASRAYRLANLALSPLVVGGLMAAQGAWRQRRGRGLVELDRFAGGFAFALGFAIVRFLFAT